MNSIAFFGAIETGLIYSLVALGVLISFRLLKFPDLTVDGSFTLGGSVAAILITNGTDPFIATAAAAAAGFAAGLLTAFLHIKLKIMDLLASILVMTALYSINLRIMGGANVPLFTDANFFDAFPGADLLDAPYAKPVIMLGLILIVKFFLDWFFSTQIGLGIRATGTNARMARAQGIPTDLMMLLGMALSNTLVGLAGALFAQANGGADASMGIGTIVIGLAAVIVGERLIRANRLFWLTMAVIIGAVLYRLFIALAISADSIGLKAQDLNLITAVLVTFVLIIPLITEKLSYKRRQRTLQTEDSSSEHENKEDI